VPTPPSPSALGRVRRSSAGRRSALSFWSHRRREHAREAVRPTQPRLRPGVRSSHQLLICPTTSSRQMVSRPEYLPGVVPKTSHDLAPASPQFRASLRSASGPARNPGPRSPQTAKLSRSELLACWQRARGPRPKEITSGRGKRRWRRFDSTKRKSTQAETRRGQDCYFRSSGILPMPRHRFDALSFSLLSSLTARPPPFNAKRLPLNAAPCSISYSVALGWHL